MPHKPFIFGQSSQEPTRPGPVSRANRRTAGEAPLFHFGLRHLFWFTAVVCMLLAAAASIEGIRFLALLLAALVVVAHVFGTALGSRLRADADNSASWPANRSLRDLRDARRLRDHQMCQPGRRSPWHGRGSTVLPWLPGLVLAGVLSGGSAGAILLTLMIGDRISAAGLVVGSLSAAVLGGWFTFLGGSFYGIFRHGLRDALDEPQNDGRALDSGAKSIPPAGLPSPPVNQSAVEPGR